MARGRGMAGFMPIEVIGLAIVIAFEVPNLFSGLLPSLFTIATFSGGSPEKVAHTKRWIRRGEVQASIMALILGAGASAMTRSPWPFLGSAGMTGYLLWQYEDALRKGSSDGPGLNMADGAT